MMADEKKRDDFTVDMGGMGPDRGREPPLKPYVPPTAAPSWVNHPLVPVLSYCGSSIMMTALNKYVLSGTGYNLNLLLLLVQSIVCILAIYTLKTMGTITYRNFNQDEAKKWFPVSVLMVGMTFTSTKALQYLSIPVYTIFKNLTIILTAYGEVLWFGGSVSRLTLFSFGLIVLSSVVAAWADIQHALNGYGHSEALASDKISTLNAGYMWMFINCFSTTSYLLYMRKRIKLTNFKDFDTMFYNNILSIPVLAVCTFVLEDWTSANILKNFPVETRDRIFFAMFITGIGTVFISYTSAWCVRVTSAATYSMVGALNKIPIAVSGLIFFDVPVTIPSVSAIIIGSISGIVYALARLQQQQKKTSGLPTVNPVISASGQSARDSLRG